MFCPGNIALAETVSERWPHFKRCMGTSLSTPAVRAGIWAEHAAIAEAILSGARGPPKAPQRTMRKRPGPRSTNV